MRGLEKNRRQYEKGPKRRSGTRQNGRAEAVAKAAAQNRACWSDSVKRIKFKLSHATFFFQAQV